MADDFSLAEGITAGEWIHAHFHRSVVFETEGPMYERAQVVSDRLQAGRPPLDRLIVEVPWIRIRTAFTLPGRYIYFSRGLIEYCPDEECAAFVVAHEIAHHDLGHLRLFPHWMGRFARRSGGAAVILAMEAVERRLYGPERECEADRHAIKLCRAAGYDPQRCLYLFHVLEQLALDIGDDAIVFGPSMDSDEELASDAPLLTKVKIWAWQRTRGYLPIRDRRQALVHLLEAEGR
ncbi:MAG TPA: M48 family metalloprotease [Gemmatimonadales bacterium]|nr:M48 family metalloprotease [Gemmatimonadales bacterium]